MPSQNQANHRYKSFFYWISSCFPILYHSRPPAHGDSIEAPPPVNENPLQLQFREEYSSGGDSAHAAVPVEQPSSANLSDSECCPICLTEFSGVVCPKILPGCEHTFHKECIDKWLSHSPNCPVCRYQVSDRKLIGETGSVVDPSTALIMTFSGNAVCGRYCPRN